MLGIEKCKLQILKCKRKRLSILNFALCNLHFAIIFNGGGKRDRTADLLVANQTLSQLSYTPSLNQILNSKF